MYIEKTFKLKLKPEESEILKECESLLKNILYDFGGINSLCGVAQTDIAFASDVLSRLNAWKELY
jgi:hypothetical protein